jgi:predicted cupin superfamily sugar epimerase
LMVPEKAQYYINQLQMLKHPEGGWYKETYRSLGSISEPDYFDGKRSYSTGIYFLLTEDNFSAFHRIKSDEMWHFYAGDGLTIHELKTDGSYVKHQLGLDLENGEQPQLVIAAKSWFASEVKKGESWCLVGCTVSPGFDFEDFEMATRVELIKLYPDMNDLITGLTRT